MLTGIHYLHSSMVILKHVVFWSLISKRKYICYLSFSIFFNFSYKLYQLDFSTLNKYSAFNNCRSHFFFTLSKVDRNYNILLVLSTFNPKKFFFIHLSEFCSKIIKESLSFLIKNSNSDFKYFNWLFDNSPSNTEFCIWCKYFLQILKTFLSTLDPPSSNTISYTNIIYNSTTYHQILNPS